MKILLSFAFFVTGHLVYSQDCFLVVSSGGGFAGTSTAYQISLDGTVRKGKGLGTIDYSEQARVKKSTAKRYYRKTRSLITSTPEFNHPGNMYYSLGTVEKNTEKKIIWGDTGHTVPEKAKTVYQDLMKILSGLTFKNAPK
jgi:hypothetical protein